MRRSRWCGPETGDNSLGSSEASNEIASGLSWSAKSPPIGQLFIGGLYHVYGPP
jgi:hypothetical protein